MQIKLSQLILIIIGSTGVTSVNANQRLQGSLLAKQECPVLHSIRKQSNPSGSLLQINQRYQVIGKNKVAASHYLITGSFGKRKQGWVATSCGIFSPSKQSSKSRKATPPTANSQYLLALSWQPSFCASHKNKKECQQLTPDSIASTQLSLHGLWPQPKNNAYCGISTTLKSIDRQKHWNSLPKLPLQPSTRKSLAKAMPGYQSLLHRHEWIKHGSCYSSDANQYYIDSIALMNEVNQSALGKLLGENIGKKLTVQRINKAIDKSYGVGSSKKVQIRCDGKNRLTELWFNLKGKVTGTNNLDTLLSRADNASQGRCKNVLIK